MAASALLPVLEFTHTATTHPHEHSKHHNSTDDKPLTDHGQPFSNFEELAAVRSRPSSPLHLNAPGDEDPSSSSKPSRSGMNPFWNDYHDDHEDHSDTDNNAREIRVKVEHELRYSDQSTDDDHSQDEHAPIRKYDERRVHNYQFRSHRQHDREEDGKERRTSPRDEAFDWNPPRNPPGAIMKKYIQVNCLHKGNFMDSSTKWMVPVDNTRASFRAFETALKLAQPEDQIIIIHVREHEVVGIPLREAYREWYSGVAVCKRYYDLLRKAGRPESSFTILLPVFYDARKICLKFAKKLGVDTIVVGKHHEEDKNTRVKNSHFRSFSSFMVKHSKDAHTMVV